MNNLLYIVTITVQNLYPLLLLFIFSIIAIYYLTLPCTFSHAFKRKSYRTYIDTLYIFLSTLVLLAITIIYWLIDTQLFSLNIPAQPYIFFVLIVTILFGYKVGLVASFFSTLLIIYYLYEPRYVINLSEHINDFILTAFSLGVSVSIGNILRKYQRKLIFESDQLKALIKARDQFTSVAAHDLRTPLTVIKLYLQQMLRDKKTTSRKAKISLKYLDAETDKVLELINSLFDFSRLESKKVILDKKRCDIIQLCKRVTKQIEKINQTHTFHFSSKASHLYVMADPLAVERAFTNLLNNAVKYSPEKSSIRFTVSTNKRFVTISIRDQGKGIPKDILEKLFDPFFQSTQKSTGLGLGLYIAKSLITMHNGELWVQSKLNKGTTFYIRLPLLKS